jgi:hypothetical protein
MQITIISFDDWHVLFDANGNKYTEGHGIQIHEVFRLLQETDVHPRELTLKYLGGYETKLEELAEYGKIPDTLEECMKHFLPRD